MWQRKKAAFARGLLEPFYDTGVAKTISVEWLCLEPSARLG
jgi:hypothetical protein